ncbi:putative DNA/RNA binding protein [Bufonid herpesvirus 1]|uniref:putative DNA/RNA binding protein n=1 Tax=Bufonid herpesvirus 1 TaxID=2282206 RepID=UPI000EB70341|nr:putative DNA/RNA binding protein [Bufonid herpesvirus 1]AXF48515.1 putative DNA/RNA binding protein [Bufonid herpesvirus 1]
MAAGRHTEWQKIQKAINFGLEHLGPFYGGGQAYRMAKNSEGDYTVHCKPPYSTAHLVFQALKYIYEATGRRASCVEEVAYVVVKSYPYWDGSLGESLKCEVRNCVLTCGLCEFRSCSHSLPLGKC